MMPQGIKVSEKFDLVCFEMQRGGIIEAALARGTVAEIRLGPASHLQAYPDEDLGVPVMITKGKQCLDALAAQAKPMAEYVLPESEA
ncbi:MAG TPA: hypothetical protein DCL54_02445 [Alphaproteobacteria bacterium]|nr:hypothetical protein [Alphaproteobacteria bacterium]